MKNYLAKTESFLENLDSYRDKFLFLFIKPYWPKAITPNHITYVRVAVGIILFVLLFFFDIENKALILSLFCFGAITDFIDGPVARGTDRVTEFGAMLDPTADRILIIPIAFFSLIHSNKWLLLAIILIEVLNGLFSLYYRSKEMYMESNIFGKIKMVILAVVFVVILIIFPSSPPAFFIYMLWLTIPLSFLNIFSKVLELYETSNQNL